MRDLSPLFEPFALKRLTLPTRIVMSTMGRNLADNGVQPPGFLDYFVRRVEGATRD